MRQSFFAGIILVSTLVLFSQLALASPLQHYEVETEIMSDASTSHRINLVFSNMTSQTFNFLITQPAYDMNATTIAGTMQCTFAKKAIGTEISCDLSGIKQQRYSIIITYKSFENVKRADGFFLFSESHKTPLDAQTMFFAVKLPEGFALIKERNDTFPPLLPYSPSFGSVGTDGRRFIVAWQKQGLKAGDGLDVSVAYEQVTGDYSGILTIFTGSIIGLVLIILLMAAGFWFVWKRFRTIKFVLPALRGDEKIIMDVLLKHGGKAVNQKIIVKESNYSKAKVSKVLKSLTERGLVSLERLGRTNRVSVVEKFEDKSSAEQKKAEQISK